MARLVRAWATLRYNQLAMAAISARLVDALCSTDDAIRADAAAQIYNTAIAPALLIAEKWRQNTQLAELLAVPSLQVTAGLAVFPAVFAKIRAAANHPALAEVPPDQDAMEFEIHFPNGISLDILTTKDPAGSGAIARYLNKFGEGIQQVEFRCRDVDAATQILRTDFATTPIYPVSRSGANNTRINFFLIATENEKLLIELYEG
jgi:hypothetical protein